MPNQNTEDLWNYYKDLAEKEGFIKDDKVNNGQNTQIKEKAYSIAWFYIDTKELNVLTRAFLADDDALTGLKSEEKVSREDIISYCKKNSGPNAHMPNDPQIDAILHSINYPITIIQGPPGTGKTETIKDLMLCLMEHDPKVKIAMVSSKSEAIENVIDKINGCDKLNKIYARLGNQTKRKEFFLSHKNEIQKYRLPDSDDKKCKCAFTAGLLEKYPIIMSTIHSLRKCIVDDSFNNQFDYVIVDECSQVASKLGLLTMASAKHLVLLGDDNQLAPIYNGEPADAELRSKAEKIGKYYLDEGSNSFLRACDERFGELAGHYMLNVHFRCHPRIIDFCNRNFYNNKLEIATKDDGKFPIRIRWYEGDYWEHFYKKKDAQKGTDSSQTNKKGSYLLCSCNMKQIRIFVEEEYGHIVEKIREDPGYSACVLSPYNYQLQLLKEEIKKYNEEHNISFGSDDCKIKENRSEEGEDAAVSIYQFTIHKAQGREYNYVCVMPVVDEIKNTWHQNARITNVAVSRAKSELCYIMSSNWMPKEKQLELLKDEEHREMRKLLDSMLGDPPVINDPDPDYNDPGKDEDDNSKDRCLRKIFKYVIENEEKCPEGSGYGLIRTKFRSVFDVNYICRTTEGKKYNKDDGSSDDLSMPEKCILHALQLKKEDGILDGFEFYYQVFLKDVEGIRFGENDSPDYIDNAHFDIVICRDNKIAYIIEIDGAEHRGITDFEISSGDADNEQIVDNAKFENRRYLDEHKDELAGSIGQDFLQMRYERIPTNGTTDNEIEKIIERIKAADEKNVITPLMKAEEL